MCIRDSEGDALAAGELTLGELLAHVADAPLVRHEVTGAQLLAYSANPRVADRLNPLSHGRVSAEPNALYYAGFEVTCDADGRGVTVALDPARRYTLVSVCPFDGPGASAPLDPQAAVRYAAIPSLQTEASAVLEQTTWDVLEALGPAGIRLSRRFAEPPDVWRAWLARTEEEMGYRLTQWPEELPTVTIDASADASVRKSAPDGNYGGDALLPTDGGNLEMGDVSHSLAYLRFPLDVPGRPVMAMLRLRTHDGSNSQSADAGAVHMVEAPWDEATVTYADRPTPGETAGALGAVELGQVSERVLLIDLRARSEVAGDRADVHGRGHLPLARE